MFCAVEPQRKQPGALWLFDLPHPTRFRKPSPPVVTGAERHGPPPGMAPPRFAQVLFPAAKGGVPARSVHRPPRSEPGNILGRRGGTPAPVPFAPCRRGSWWSRLWRPVPVPVCIADRKILRFLGINAEVPRLARISYIASAARGGRIDNCARIRRRARLQQRRVLQAKCTGNSAAERSSNAPRAAPVSTSSRACAAVTTRKARPSISRSHSSASEARCAKPGDGALRFTWAVP